MVIRPVLELLTLVFWANIQIEMSRLQSTLEWSVMSARKTPGREPSESRR